MSKINPGTDESWECLYCGNINSNKDNRCPNCYAPRCKEDRSTHADAVIENVTSTEETEEKEVKEDEMKTDLEQEEVPTSGKIGLFELLLNSVAFICLFICFFRVVIVAFDALVNTFCIPEQPSSQVPDMSVVINGYELDVFDDNKPNKVIVNPIPPAVSSWNVI